VNSNNLSENQDYKDEQSKDKKSGVLVECFVCGSVWTADDHWYQCPQCGGEDVEPVRR